MNGRDTYTFTDPAYHWLLSHARNIYSQYGEDGVVDAILDRIGALSRWCFECGAADGVMFSNTRRLIERGWMALLVEADVEKCQRLAAITTPNCKIINAKVTPENIDTILSVNNAPKEPDVFSLDIDGQDWHVWNSMLHYWPRIVLIEHAVAGTCHFDYIPTVGGPGIAGAGAMFMLGSSKGYTTIVRTFTNTIFVRGDLVGPLQIPLDPAK